jgi:hypothetical protein
MGTRVDCTNEFKDSESKALEYPLCLVRKQAFHHTLDAYKSALEQPRVLDPSHRKYFAVGFSGDGRRSVYSSYFRKGFRLL